MMIQHQTITTALYLFINVIFKVNKLIFSF